MDYKRATKMPAWVQGQFLPLWRQWLKDYETTGYFQGSETGEKPTKFAMHMMNMEQSEIDYWYKEEKHSFITVRLDNSTPLGEVRDKLENMKFQWMTLASARIELHSTDGTKNHHVHILSTQVNKHRAIRDLSRYFKVNKENVDVKNGEKCELYDKRSNYIQGIKQDKKSEAIELDRKVLDDLDIQQIYSIENI